MEEKDKKCRHCKEPMTWIEGLRTIHGYPMMEFGRYACKNCKIHLQQKESRAVRKGRSIAKEYENENVFGKKMLSLPSMVQLGILRELQK